MRDSHPAPTPSPHGTYPVATSHIAASSVVNSVRDAAHAASPTSVAASHTAAPLPNKPSAAAASLMPAPATFSPSPSRGVRVGALVAPKRHLQTVISALDERQWRKPCVRPVDADDGWKAVAVTPDGAVALDASHPLPPSLARLLEAGEVRWASGLRATAATPVPHTPPSAPPACFTFAELFAGIGGFRLGLERLGGRCVFASEIDPHAAATYARHFCCVPSGDITAIDEADVPPHDLLTAGFPCQSFSRTGRADGFSDGRGALFYEVVRVAAAARPAALLLENVPNLLRVDRGHALHQIVRALGEVGYTCRVHVLNARALVPQHRERLFVVAFRSDLRCAAASFKWPQLAHSAPALRSVLEPARAAYQLSSGQWKAVLRSREWIKQPQWRLAQLEGAARTLRGSYRSSFTRFSEFVPTTSEQEALGRRDGDARGGCEPAWGEEDVGMELGGEDEPEGERDGEGVEGEVVEPARFYTERECARIQGFPDSLELCGAKLYKQIGNAVCPPLVEVIGRQILLALDIAPALPDGTDHDRRPCESFLSAAAINVLRSVTPPDEGEASEQSEYGRYAAESAEERLARVCRRSPDKLFCSACAATYSLTAVPPGGSA
ncbi:hypothetical protein AB1Y20_008402 [Prymnesium parvum]|uniref:Cytosine-specific methyltransferase n=1 Tax=Prymnesium parvum TaxID=97485 RepID=A0AB34ISB3_PRYPA